MKRIFAFLSFVSFVGGVCAQVVSTASFMRPQAKSDVAVPFRYLDEGVVTPIEWGLDLAWLSEDNIRCGVTYAGRDVIDIIRTSYMPTESVEGGALSNAQINKIRRRANIIKQYAKPGVSLNLNDDHASVDAWYNASNISSEERGKRWAQVIDLTIKKYAEYGLTNFVSISPYNEPDYGWDQGLGSTRKADFLNTCKSLRQDFDGAYDNVRMCGGNTLNDDKAYEWWNYLKLYLDEGNTHQLAGNFDNYANFFKQVRNYGHHATADELHNTMEAMVGVEYGMQTGIWWGTCEYTRSQFMKATCQSNPGRRLGYGEHRANWTSAAVYRHPGGRVQAFGGTSERQAVDTRYAFVCLDRPVWYDGLPGRGYVMWLPGGTGYQQGQTNAEGVVDVQSGEDIMPHIDGTYKVVNMKSGMVMGFGSAPTSGWVSTSQRKNSNTAKYLQWNVKPVGERAGGDFSYYIFTLNTTAGMILDIKDWNLNAGADVGAYPGGRGTNEQWYLEYAGNGAFYIRSRFSTKYLGVLNGSDKANANIEMQNFSGDASQQWRFLPADVTPDFEAPASPANLVATSNTASVRLDWEASESEDLAGYTIMRSDNGTDFYAIAKQVTGTSFTDNEALDGQSYTYCVCAVDKSLNMSEHSATVTGMVTGERDCICWLPFDATCYDMTPNGNHCTLSGDTTWAEPQRGANAITLKGSDNFIQLPYTVANHDELTVACWVYWLGGNTWQRLWHFGTDDNHYMYLTPKSGNGMRFAIKNGETEQRVTYTQNLKTNAWVHVALSIGAEGASLYVNGKAVVTNTKVTLRPSDITPAFNYIGRSLSSSDPYFNGTIDDFRIYNYALSAEEISALIDEPDAIESIASDPTSPVAAKASQGTTYDLQGRRALSTTKGIVIRNGRKEVRE